MKEVKIEIDYPGSIISVNHYKFKGRYTKKEALDWMDELGWVVKPLHLEEWKLPLTVRCDGHFRDKRSCPDLHNLMKVICDSIEWATGINDRYFRTETGDAVVDKTKEPTLTITIKEAADD